jgi:hypothetical protein
MKRNIVALISGFMLYYFLVISSIFIQVNFGSSSLRGAFLGNEMNEGRAFYTFLGQSLLLDLFLIYPVISFITGFVVGLIATRRKYLLSAISVIPFYFAFYLIPLFATYSRQAFIYSAVALLTFGISVGLGTYFSIVLRRRWRVTE